MNYVKLSVEMRICRIILADILWGGQWIRVVNSVKLQNGIRLESQVIIRKLPRCMTMVIVKVATSVYTGNCQEAKDIDTPWDISSRRDQFVWRQN